MAEPIITAAAEAEYLESLLWYAERSPAAAEGFRPSLPACFERLPTSRIGSPRSTTGAALMRRYPFQVAYRREREQIVVIAVAHVKRRPRYWEKR